MTKNTNLKTVLKIETKAIVLLFLMEKIAELAFLLHYIKLPKFKRDIGVCAAVI